MELFDGTATECHLPYGITQCYLLPDTSEHTPPYGYWIFQNMASIQPYIAAFYTVAVLGYGRGGGTGFPNLAQAPKFLIGSIVISLSRCCLPNDEGPGPQIFFLKPPLLLQQTMSVKPLLPPEYSVCLRFD